MSFLKGVDSEIEVFVNVEIAGSLGKTIKVPFKAKFKRLSVDEIKALGERLNADQTTPADLVRENLLGWRDLEGKDGEQVPFTLDNLEDMMQSPPYLNALVSTFFDSLSGVARERNRAKNS